MSSFQNASSVLKSLTSLFHLFANIMGNVLGFIDDLVGCLFRYIGRIVYLVFRFVFDIAHGLGPFSLLVSPGLFACFGSVFCRLVEVLGSATAPAVGNGGDSVRIVIVHFLAQPTVYGWNTCPTLQAALFVLLFGLL
jgi:hypothetical protein